MKKDQVQVQKPAVPTAPSKKSPKEVVEDVEMKDVDGTTDDALKDVDSQTLEEIKEHVKHVEKAVVTKEPRFMSRSLRALISLRKRLNSRVLQRTLIGYFPVMSLTKDWLLDVLGIGPELLNETIENGDKNHSFRPRSGKAASQPLLPEVEIYVHLLVVLHLIDTKNYEAAVCSSDSLMKKISSYNRRTLDLLAAKCYFYHSRVYELANNLDHVRSLFHARLRTCTLRSDHEGQATLLNLLLRNYLHYNLYDQADKLVSKCTFPEDVTNNEWARYLYYLGRIKAIQLEYTDAHNRLLQALRKAPQHTAVGFKQTVQKLAIIVELLLGDIPDRSIFRQDSMRKTLQPYFQITQAVRTGNMAKFNEVLKTYSDRFKSEGMLTLITRLRHNVIKTGVRMIILSYLRISLADVARKLCLDSPEDAEFIVAKAIRDGVIEAVIDHQQSFVQSKENADIYRTKEPMAAFHQRTSFCLEIRNQSVKAMRFPPKSYNKDLESAEERREREQMELESAKEITDDFEDTF